MDDLLLQARIDEHTTLTVSPLDEQTYAEYVGDESLGGSDGYFVTRTSKLNNIPRFEILAKAPTFEAADTLFRLIVSSSLKRSAA